MLTDNALDLRARRAARRVGLSAKKTRWRKDSCDNYGGYRLDDPYYNMVRYGDRFTLSAEDVIEICRDLAAAE